MSRVALAPTLTPHMPRSSQIQSGSVRLGSDVYSRALCESDDDERRTDASTKEEYYTSSLSKLRSVETPRGSQQGVTMRVCRW